MSGLPPLEFCAHRAVFRHDGRWPSLMMGWGYRVRVPDVGVSLAELAVLMQPMAPIYLAFMDRVGAHLLRRIMS